MNVKPCPFCGNEPDYWEDNQYQDRHVIECGYCGTTKRSEYGYDGVLHDCNTRTGHGTPVAVQFVTDVDTRYEDYIPDFDSLDVCKYHVERVYHEKLLTVDFLYSMMKKA